MSLRGGASTNSSNASVLGTIKLASNSSSSQALNNNTTGVGGLTTNAAVPFPPSLLALDIFSSSLGSLAQLTPGGFAGLNSGFTTPAVHFQHAQTTTLLAAASEVPVTTTQDPENQDKDSISTGGQLTSANLTALNLQSQKSETTELLLTNLGTTDLSNTQAMGGTTAPLGGTTSSQPPLGSLCTLPVLLTDRPPPLSFNSAVNRYETVQSADSLDEVNTNQRKTSSSTLLSPLGHGIKNHYLTSLDCRRPGGPGLPGYPEDSMLNNHLLAADAKLELTSQFLATSSSTK